MKWFYISCACLLSSLNTHAIPGLNSEDRTNDPERAEEFMDWGMGLFIHWGVDVELGSVISHSMVGASEDYLERYISELPK
ncbi:MAG TPA: hypothetical protein VJ952_04085, partial [Opitutales bacterium]|nr:hypothetical protein [Opitutales bacterium]